MIKELIEKFIKGLNKDNVLSEEQIVEFESFGADIVKAITEAEETAVGACKKEAEEEADEKEAELEESFKDILTKIDEVKEKELTFALCNFKEQQDLTTKEEQIVDSMSKYLNAVVEEHLPEQAIVDYAKLDRSEKTIGAIRESVIVTDDQVQEKISTTLEGIETELTEKSTLLDDAIRRNIEYKTKMDRIVSDQTLNEKLEDLPEFEQRKLKRIFSEASSEEIREEFDTTLENIRLNEYDVDSNIDVSSVIKEDLMEEEVISDIDQYAILAERWLPKK